MNHDGLDPFWAQVIDFLEAAGLSERRIVAPREFGGELALVAAYEDAPALPSLDVLVVHKGRVAELPAALLGDAAGMLPVVYANEVFVVLAPGLPAVAAGSAHLAGWEAALTDALASRGMPAAAPRLQMRLGGRMAAIYLGGGRVLLETAFGRLMLAAGADTSITPHLIRDGWFDYGVTTVLNRLLRPGMTYVDVGANVGAYALIAAEIVGEAGRVVAIEPVPRLAAMLHETLVMNGFGERCRVVREAAGAIRSAIRLFEFATRQGGTSALDHVAAAARRDYGEEVSACEVTCRPLDLILPEAAPGRTDVIKIDVEGFESAVLEGARGVIATMRPSLLIEWHLAFFEGRDGAEALHRLLTHELGYVLHRIEADGDLRPILLDELLRLPHSDLLAVHAC